MNDVMMRAAFVFPWCPEPPQSHNDVHVNVFIAHLHSLRGLICRWCLRGDVLLRRDVSRLTVYVGQFLPQTIAHIPLP